MLHLHHDFLRSATEMMSENAKFAPGF